MINQETLPRNVLDNKLEQFVDDNKKIIEDNLDMKDILNSLKINLFSINEHVDTMIKDCVPIYHSEIISYVTKNGIYFKKINETYREATIFDIMQKAIYRNLESYIKKDLEDKIDTLLEGEYCTF